MKKLTSLLAMVLMMAMTATFFVSCTTEDEYEAYTLEGAWEGDMGVVFGGYRSVRSVIYFDRDPYRYASGSGYQADYFNQSGWGYRYDYIANNITWSVRNGVIRIHYLEEDVYAEISEYSLNNGYFEGYIDYEDGSSSRFHLRKTYAPNNWRSSYDWGWWDDYDWYWSKPATEFDETRAADGDSTTMVPMKPKRGATGNAHETAK